MAMSGPDPVGSGLIASLARPGGNITGLAGQTDEFPSNHLELLREIMPGLTDVMVLYNPAGVLRPEASLAAIATSLGLRLHGIAITRAEELEPTFSKAASPANWAVVTLADPVVIARLRVLIAALALKHRLPSAHNFRIGAEAGGLFSYGVNLDDMARRSAYFVDKILKGTKTTDLPVEQATKFELIVNQRVARELGIIIPQQVLVRADEVIE